MARTRSNAADPVVTPLEHHVPVEWAVVGTPDWLEEAWEPGALDGINTYPVNLETADDDLAPVLDYLWALRTCGADTETAGPYKAGDKNYSMNPLNPDTRVVLLQLGNRERVFLIEPALIPYFKDYLESDQVLHVGHNIQYDFKWLLVKYGVHLQRLYCSMLAEQILTAGLMGMKVGLADSVRRRAPYWIINKAVRDHFVHLDHVHGCPDCEGGVKRLTRKMGYYAARDIVLLFPLVKEQVDELKHWQLQRVAQIEFDIIPATSEMEIGGVDLDRTVMNQIIEAWTQKEKDLAQEFFTIFFEERRKAGNEPDMLFANLEIGFNLKSGPAKLQALRELDIDLDNVQRNTLKNAAKGKVEKKVGRRTVEVKVDFTPAQRRMLEIFAEITKAFKMTSTYGRNMLEKISNVTGRWHPRFKQLGSGEEEGRRSGSDDKNTIATGRFSSDAQQFPKPKEEWAAVANAFEAKQVKHHFADAIRAAQAAHAAQAANTSSAA